MGKQYYYILYIRTLHTLAVFTSDTLFGTLTFVIPYNENYVGHRTFRLSTSDTFLMKPVLYQPIEKLFKFELLSYFFVLEIEVIFFDSF